MGMGKQNFFDHKILDSDLDLAESSSGFDTESIFFIIFFGREGAKIIYEVFCYNISVFCFVKK